MLVETVHQVRQGGEADGLALVGVLGVEDEGAEVGFGVQVHLQQVADLVLAAGLLEDFSQALNRHDVDVGLVDQAVDVGRGALGLLHGRHDRDQDAVAPAEGTGGDVPVRQFGTVEDGQSGRVDRGLAGRAARDGEVLGRPEELGHGVCLGLARHQLAGSEDGQEADAALGHSADVQGLGRIISEVRIDCSAAEQASLLAGLQHLAANVEALLLGLDCFDLILRRLPGAPVAAAVQCRDVHDLPRHP
ncbi:hypothetical protein D3C72_1119930 [compost metagenome]